MRRLHGHGREWEPCSCLLHPKVGQGLDAEGREAAASIPYGARCVTNPQNPQGVTQQRQAAKTNDPNRPHIPAGPLGSTSQVATEKNLPETAFVERLETDAAAADAERYALRWFTPTCEVPKRSPKRSEC